jgi:hypothetical protein
LNPDLVQARTAIPVQLFTVYGLRQGHTGLLSVWFRRIRLIPLRCIHATIRRVNQLRLVFRSSSTSGKPMAYALGALPQPIFLHKSAVFPRLLYKSWRNLEAVEAVSPQWQMLSPQRGIQSSPPTQRTARLSSQHVLLPQAQAERSGFYRQYKIFQKCAAVGVQSMKSPPRASTRLLRIK